MKLQFDRILAMLIVLIGAGTMICWLFYQERLFQTHPAIFNMVFNTALCFTLIGIVYLFHIYGSLFSDFLLIVVSGFVVMLSLAILLEYIFKSNIDINQLFVTVKHTTLHKDPGRMSAVTAVALIAAGLAMTLLRTIKSNCVFFIVHVLILTILFMSIFGVIQNNIFKLIYAKYAYNPMARQTAFSLLLLSGILWSDWYHVMKLHQFELNDINIANLVRIYILYLGVVITFLVLLMTFS